MCHHHSLTLLITNNFDIWFVVRLEPPLVICGLDLEDLEALKRQNV